MSYSVISGESECDRYSSILINGHEYSRNMRGLNFVVYNNKTGRIIDEVSFDICSGDTISNR